MKRELTLEEIHEELLEQLKDLRKREIRHDSVIVTRWSPNFTETMINKYCPIEET